ncbi:unnamed protein product [Miscanthus lutarioriparius]|uniref:Uncharacterized protein n=1 Tax=Miscanthus lutarioriparius TaxID=422564 RepID=A0A811M9U7_9POAL|nr:unnamed protein product [Miscanthus lutarioriparius]
MAMAMMSMCVAVCVVVLSLAVPLPAMSSDGATPATLPPVRVVGLSPMMVPRVHDRLEDDRQAADAEMDMDSGVHRRVVLTILQMQATSPPYLGYGSLNEDNAACGSSCVGRPGAPYLPASRPCATYYQCPSTPS